MSIEQKPESGTLRAKLYEIIFEAETIPGKTFDVALLILILVSVLIVLLETVADLQQRYGQTFYILEWVITVFFTAEYFLRIYSSKKSWRYMTSFYGVVDLIAIIPTYISLIFSGAQYLLVVRVLRLLRIFRIFKLTRYVLESRVLIVALRASLPKIIVFLFSVVTVIVIVGAVMYLVEGPEHGFVNIPVSIYWAIVTLTTVGYGDIAPQTPLGKFLACLVMILGYGIIAVPTGIVTVELSNAASPGVTLMTCPSCEQEGHDGDASYCKYCSAALASQALSEE